ncbi:DUF190 domain-containing protein [Enterobacter sp. ABFQC]|uniref:DUF190 domain-containing protein n=1 Tax=Enterobacter sp. ABFQC TaxID=1778656 RepID=UPI00136C8D29|nr:DUF190 domain-containing protein [Enterobacter sp. ABFQC]MXV05462.1 hypothetical protein [Enterobacter sp. ABFQC]
MKGYQITFYTQQDRMHGTVPLAQWMIEQAKLHGLRGATLTAGIEGLGHDGVTHAINLFDISEQPIQITFIVTSKEAESMFIHLQKENIKIFYMIAPVEFGVMNTDGFVHPNFL